MIEKIGKYRIIERIGRGGMGTVFKAHDPILDRLVALKVISSEGEVTDELKARFYREAQACARLNHPNIVVVHDLGEDAGRLYIVMEFLDGEELKLLIGQRRALPLEDKLSLMTQVCDGLHYAHQNGVIHRDIKPGNIFVLRNGQVKILDFGIARIAAADTGLTRTGLIMGTLRYMSPEQARGRVDHRSDMFSAGAVFYELLAYKAAFDADDPMETLEKLRSEDPPPLAEIDPSLPADLIGAIEKALKKDPNQRFADLGQMRIKLEQVRRRLTDEAERIQAQVRGQIDQLAELKRRLGASLHETAEDETLPVVDERARVDDLRGLERQLAEQIAELRAKVERAEATQPAVDRAVQLLEQGDLAAAVAALEAVLREAPDQPQAQEALRRARARQEAVARLLAEARAAHEQHAEARCLELLDELARASAAAAADPAVAQLRQAAETAGRARATAEAARQAARDARAAAEQGEAARHAAAVWKEAEGKAAEGERALGQHAHRDAEARFREAAAAYQRAAATAREAAEALRAALAQAEAAGQEAARGRQAAAERNAASYAAKVWGAAQAKEASAQAALGRQDHAAARTLFGEARRLYEEAGREAAAAAEAEAQRKAGQAEADRLRQTVAAARRAAEEAGARRLSTAAFAKGEAAEQSAAEAIGRQAFGDARSHLHAAEQAYQEAGRLAVEARAAARGRAEEAGRLAVQAKEGAATANAAAQAAAKWAAAQGKEAGGRTALGKEEYAAAQTLLAEAQRLYEEAGREARAAAEAEVRRKAEQAELARLKEAVLAARRAAEEAGAPKAAAAALAEARGAEQAGEAAMGRGAAAEAQARLRAAEQAYQQAARQAAELVKGGLAEAQRLLGEGRADRALEALGRVRAAAPGHPELAALEGQARRAVEARKIQDQVRGLVDAAKKLQARGELAKALEQANQAARLVPDEAAVVRLRDDLDEALRQAAAAAEAAARRKTEAEAEARRRTEAAAEARRRADAEAEARRRAEAEAEARRAAQRADVIRVQQAVAAARRTAEQVGAPQATPPAFAEARAAEQAGEAALAQGAVAEAATRFGAAEAAYRQVAEVAGEQAVRAALAEAPRLIGEGRPDRALELLGRALIADPDDPELGRLDEQARRLLDARKVRERVRGLLESARKLQARGEVAKAYELAEQAANLVPDDAAALRLRDDLHERLREAGEAPRPAAPAPAAPAVASAAPEVERAPVRLPGPPRGIGRGKVAAGAGVLVAVVVAVVLALRPGTKIEPPPVVTPPRVQPTPAPVQPAPSVPPERTKAEAQRQAMLTARDDARQVEAERLAADTWRAAGDKERDAEAAFGKDDFTRAEAGYADAQRRYAAAAAEARQRIVDLTETAKVRPLQDQAGQARRRAELVDAAKLAPPSWAKATGDEKSADDALKRREFDKAAALYRQAEQGYKVAESEAAQKKAALSREEQEKLEAQRRDLDATTRLASAAAEARTKADGVNSTRYAPKTYALAVDKESEAKAALGRKDYSGAQRRFREAQQEYERAQQEASRAAEGEKKEQELQAQRQRDAEQARGLMAGARSQAEQADAKRLAEKLYKDALAKESDAQAALGRGQYTAALQRFKDAQQEYERARGEAAKAADAEKKEQELQVQRQHDAEQLQKLVVQARTQAEQADARRLATKLFQDAAAKESDGQAAFGRRDWAGAQQRFRDAQQEYDRARGEAVKAADADKQKQIALIKQQGEETARQRQLAVGRREQAQKGEADRLAKDLFDAGRSAEAEADGQSSRQAYAAAITAYQQAAARYGEALTRAQAVRQERAEADDAKSRMQAEKQRARADASDFKAGLAAEQQGDQTYQRLAFKEAAGHYGTAQGLFAKAATPPPAPPKPPAADPRAEIRAVLDSYKKAIEGKDLALFQQVRPNLSDAELKRVRASFEQSKSQNVDLKVDSIEVNGDEAQARGRRTDVFIPKEGRPVQNEAPFLFKFKRTGNSWVIQAVN